MTVVNNPHAHEAGATLAISPPAISARPQMTADLMVRTGLDDAMLARLVHAFYDRIRSDPLLGPIFADHVTEWAPHLAKMVDFWPSVALMTGRYHGAPMPKHLPLPVDAQHFDRWLTLFRATAIEICLPEGAARVIDRAERIAASIQMNIQDARGGYRRAEQPPQL